MFTRGLVSARTGWGAATICDAPSLFQPQMRNSCGSVLFIVHQLVGADPGHHGAQLGTRLLDRMSGGPLTGGLQFRLTCAVVEDEAADETASLAVLQNALRSEEHTSEIQS